MNSGRVEITFLFQKFSNSDLKAASTESIIERIGSYINDYVSHSTRAYKKGDYVYVSTELRFKPSLKPPLTQDNLTALMQGDLENDPYKIGKSFSSKTPVLAYSLVLSGEWIGKRFICSEDSRRFAICISKFGKNLFAFRDVESPIAATLFGSDLELPPARQICHTENGDYDVSFNVGLEMNGYIFQKERRILQPGMKFAEFMTLSLSADLPDNHSNPPTFTVSEIVILLHELTCSSADKAQVISRFTDKVFRTRILRRIKICESFKWELPVLEGSPPTYNVPMKDVKCEIPKIGPTIFSSHKTRSYALSFTVKLDYEGTFTRLTQFMEVNIAEKSRSRKKVLLLDPGVYTTVDMFDVVRLQRAPHSKFVPSMYDDHEIERIAQSGHEFLKYDAEGFVDGLEISMMTLFVIRIPRVLQVEFLDDLIKVANERGLKALGDEPHWRDTDLVLCNPSNSKWRSDDFFGQFQFASGEKRFRYCLPILTSFTIRHLPFFYVHEPEFSLTFYVDVDFRSHANNSYAGCAIIDPSLSLAQIFKIQIVSWDTFRSHYYFKAQQLALRKLKISISEDIGGDWLENQAALRRLQLIVSKNIELDYPEEVSAITKHRTGRACVTFPADLYDQNLPRLAPSMFSNDLYRSYSIVIEVHTLKTIYNVRRRFDVAMTGNSLLTAEQRME